MPRLPPEPLTADEMMRLIGACGQGSCGRRDRALLVLLWRTGLRISEALALEMRDIDRAATGWTIRVRHGKGDQYRTVAAGPDIAVFFEAWFEARNRLTTSKFVFCTVKSGKGVKGSRMKSSTVRKLLPALAEKAGIEKRVHCHGMRHTFAIELDSEGQPLRVIQQSLGHVSAHTTSRYLSALGSGEVIRALQARQMPSGR